MRNKLARSFEFKFKEQFELEIEVYNPAVYLFQSLAIDSLDFDQVTQDKLFNRIYKFCLPSFGARLKTHQT